MHFHGGRPVCFIGVQPDEHLKMTQGPEPQLMEGTDRRLITSNGVYIEVLGPQAPRLFDRHLDQAPTDPSASRPARDHYRFDRGLAFGKEQPGHPDHDTTVIDGNPGGNSLRQRQILIEAQCRVVATDVGRIVDLAMMADELVVQTTAH